MQCYVRSIDYIFFLVSVVRVACNAIMQLYCTLHMNVFWLTVSTDTECAQHRSKLDVWSGRRFRNERRYSSCLKLLLLLHSCRYCSTVHFCFFFCLLHCLVLLLVLLLGCFAMLGCCYVSCLAACIWSILEETDDWLVYHKNEENDSWRFKMMNVTVQ